MTDRRLMPVQVGVVKEVLVDRMLGLVLDREPAEPVAPVKLALDASLDVPICDGGALDLRMRGIGYLVRAVEAELFEPAREPMPGLAELLTSRIAAGENWTAAASAVSAQLAWSEPLRKPAPGDDDAVSWKVPGPGGHVRHYVVAAAIAELSRDDDDRPDHRGLPAGITDAGELKRCWTYGFMIRCCEEALQPES